MTAAIPARTDVAAVSVGKDPDSLAVYFHWPFCLSKCPYCDFNSHVRESIDDARWQQAFLAQIDVYAERIGPRRIGSIFFGGGTPSLMPAALVAAMLDRVASRWTVADSLEVTLEANPAAVDRRRFRDLAAAGVNRVSIGVQSFDDAALNFLGRGHSAADAAAAIDIAARCFDRWSFDLIYALPDQSPNDWAKDLRAAIERSAGHLSLYQLTIEPGTAFHAAWARGDLAVPDSDRAGDLYEVTQEIAADAGLPAYEISNHARAGQESQHNLTYWRYGDYVGIGPGAHGRFVLNETRHATRHHRAPEIWLERALNARHPFSAERGSTTVGARDAATEALMMGLRTVEGVPYARLEQLAGSAVDVVDRAQIATLTAAGYLEPLPDVLRATQQGRQRLDAVLAAVLL